MDQEQYRKELGTKDKRREAISCIVFGLLYKTEKVSYTRAAKVPYCSLLLVEIKESSFLNSSILSLSGYTVIF